MKKTTLQNLTPRKLSRKMDVALVERGPSSAMTGFACVTIVCH